MKQKFFRIEWEGEDDIDENEVSIALSSWFDRHYDVRNPPIEEIEAFEISDKVFEEKPKKVEKIDLPNPARMTGWRDIDIWASGFNKCLELVMKLNDQRTNRGGE